MKWLSIANFNTAAARIATKTRGFIVLVPLALMAGNAAHAENAAQEPEWLQPTMTLADARHLLGRTGFGATPERLAQMLGLTRAQAVQNIVDGVQTQPHIPMPSFVDKPAPHFWTRRDMPQAQRQAFDQARDSELRQLRQWWVNNMLQTDSPQTERLVLFWHDHFATSYHGVDRRSISMARQNQLFREYASGSYREFLKQLIRDPAMLRYLDNTSNKKGKPNENLARELMELFTLGEGNYDEATVLSAAKALTGYSVSQTNDESFQFNAYHHDFEQNILFGKVGHFDGDALIDLILEQPAAAEHLVKRYWHAFVSDQAPDQAYVEKLSQEFRGSDYNLRTLYTLVLRDETFWHPEQRLSMIKSPATLLIGTARSLDYPKHTWTQLPALHSLLGMDLFAPPNVSGWSEGAAFVTPGKLLNRQLALQTLTDDTRADTVADSGNMMMATQETPVSAPLEVQLAAHLYEGAPQYQVSLLNDAEKTIWQSDARVLNVGYDTEMFGQMQDREQLSWTNVPYNPPKDLVNESHYVQVEFLNDAAGKNGDRNLFVDAVLVNGVRFPSAGAKQTSHCPPSNANGAGNLYCAGDVKIDISVDPTQHAQRLETITARNASLLWGNKNKQRINAIITLEHVHTPHAYFHTLSFQLVSRNNNHLEVWIDNHGCTPTCVQTWPTCSVAENNPSLKTLRFSLRKNANGCGLETLVNAQDAHIQTVVNTIFNNVPKLIEHVKDSTAARADRIQSVIAAWEKRMPDLQALIADSMTNKERNTLAINDQYSIPEVVERSLPAPNMQYPSLSAYQQMLNDTDLSLAQLVIGGVEVQQFPALHESAGKPIEQQLQTVLNHPIFQVY